MSINYGYIHHRKRLRKRFVNSDGHGLSDYELIELLLTYSIPRKDVKPVAKRLIKHFGGLTGILDASADELAVVGGVGEISSILILLVRKCMEMYLEENLTGKDILTSPQLVVNFARGKISGNKDELFVCIFVNTKNELISYEIVQEGTIDQVIVYPRKIMESALAKKASAIILVHNHPSGYTDPSQEDRDLTTDIIKVAKLFDIRVLDHIIVGRRGYFSFKENGII